MDKTSREKRAFLHYKLESDALCLGERIRCGIFRPCIDVFTYTALSSSLKARFPQPYRKIHAVGQYETDSLDSNVRDVFVFSPRDRGKEVSTIPLQIECITNVKADIYIEKNDFTVNFPSEFNFHFGAMKSKGFGFCSMKLIDCFESGNPSKGILNVRIPEDESLYNVFNIRTILSPVYGYLFEPHRGGTGKYIRAFFEGTSLVADSILIKRRIS